MAAAGDRLASEERPVFGRLPGGGGRVRWMGGRTAGRARRGAVDDRRNRKNSGWRGRAVPRLAKLVSENEAQDLKKLPDSGQEIGGALYRRALHASDLLTAGAALASPDPKVLDLDDNDRALQSLYESLESLRERRRLLFAAGQTSQNKTERPTVDALRDIDTQMASLHARVREQITQRNIARTRFVSKNAGETPTESQKTTAQRLVQKFVQAAALDRVSQSEARLLQQHIADLADTEARRMTTEEYADHVADVASGFASSVANEVRAMNKAAAALSQRLGSAQTDVAYICNRLNEISRTATPSEKHAINQALQKLYKNLGSQLTHDAQQSYRKLFKLLWHARPYRPKQIRNKKEKDLFFSESDR